jgi:hypothetical protein
MNHFQQAAKNQLKDHVSPEMGAPTNKLKRRITGCMGNSGLYFVLLLTNYEQTSQSRIARSRAFGMDPPKGLFEP